MSRSQWEYEFAFWTVKRALFNLWKRNGLEDCLHLLEHMMNEAKAELLQDTPE